MVNNSVGGIWKHTVCAAFLLLLKILLTQQGNQVQVDMRQEADEVRALWDSEAGSTEVNAERDIQWGKREAMDTDDDDDETADMRKAVKVKRHSLVDTREWMDVVELRSPLR